jgi:signal transduction histidine kinase
MHRPKPTLCLLLICLFCLCNKPAQGQLRQIGQELRKISSVRDSVSLVNSLNRLGTLYNTRNIDSCFYYGTKAKRIAIGLHYRKGQTDADHVIAVALFQRGLYAESLELLSKVLADYKKLADTANIVCVYADMANVLNKDIDKTKVITFLQRAIQIGGKLKQDSIMAGIYINYCNRNPNLSADSINYYLSKSREIAYRYKDESNLAFNRLWQADLLIKKGKKQEALSLIKWVLSDVKRTGDVNLEINMFFTLAGYYYDDTPRKSLEYCYQAYQLARKNGDRSLEVYLLTNILEQTTKFGNKDEIIRAHVALEKAMVAEKENTKKFIGDYVRYNAIQDDNTLLSEKNARKTSYLIVVVISLIAVVLVLLKLWHNRKQLLVLNNQISTQNSSMQKTLNALEQSQADNTRMMQIVAHDLRNPIGAMFSIASIMLDEERPEKDKELLEMVKTSGQNSLNLVSELLQVQTNADELKREPVDLGQLLYYCVDLLRHKAEVKGQQIDLQASAVIIPANREKLWRVISNLIANAIKFSPMGATIRVSLKEKKDQILITVEDHGIGIPLEIAPKIFDMFTDAKRSGTAGEEPFGLGLAISKQIVEAHGGKLWFDSKPGYGATFFVELPVVNIEDTHATI